MAESVKECRQGVRMTRPFSREAASRTESRVMVM
jgi:hypothetical protein